MNGAMRAQPYGIYKYMKEYRAQINYKLSRMYFCILRISDDLEIKFKILESGTMYFLVHKSAHFNDKRLYEAGTILAKRIKGIILHREICRENDMHVIRKLDETYIFNELDIEIRSIKNSILYDCLHLNNFLSSLELKGVNNDEIFEEITVSLIYDRSLLEDLEKNII